MLTVALALLIFILLHQSNEGIACIRRMPVRVPVPVLAAVQVGRVQVIIRLYRPCRLYFRFALG
jgi:hypothetical protein